MDERQGTARSEAPEAIAVIDELTTELDRAHAVQRRRLRPVWLVAALLLLVAVADLVAGITRPRVEVVAGGGGADRGPNRSAVITLQLTLANRGLVPVTVDGPPTTSDPLVEFDPAPPVRLAPGQQVAVTYTGLRRDCEYDPDLALREPLPRPQLWLGLRNLTGTHEVQFDPSAGTTLGQLTAVCR